MDHVIVRVTNALESARFYESVLSFKHEGRVGPFEIIRVNEGMTLDLMEMKPKDPQHLAFELTEPEFNQAFDMIRSRRIAYGGAPFEKDNSGPGVEYGARGYAKAVYISDPDGHNLEIRFYEQPLP